MGKWCIYYIDKCSICIFKLKKILKNFPFIDFLTNVLKAHVSKTLLYE